MFRDSVIKRCAVCGRYSSSSRLMKSFLSTILIGIYKVSTIQLWICETCQKENTKKGFEKPEICAKWL
jgi:hypothetical protein